jgi:hypothetical protein
MPSGFIEFELDLMKAFLNALVPALDEMKGASLTLENASKLPEAQGVYLLIHEGFVRYVGKADSHDGLRTRLVRHVRKFDHRKNIAPADVTFKAAQVFVLTAMDVESRLIKKYGAKWNGSGFGSNDPGRERETTNKPEQGFDTQFPIDIDLPLEIVPPGRQDVLSALIALKEALPYDLRYETSSKGSQAYRLKPHPDYLASKVTIPAALLSVRQLMRLIVHSLPPGWQSTEFVSHIILYKEGRSYVHGRII